MGGSKAPHEVKNSITLLTQQYTPSSHLQNNGRVYNYCISAVTCSRMHGEGKDTVFILITPPLLFIAILIAYLIVCMTVVVQSLIIR